MALVSSAFECLGLATAGEVESFEVIDARDTASAEYLEILLPNCSIPVRSVQQICHRAILKADDDGDVVAAVASCVRQCRGRDCLYGAAHHSSSPIDEMTQLANDPAAILRVLDPAVAGDKPSVTANVYQHGLGASGEEVLQLFR